MRIVFQIQESLIKRRVGDDFFHEGLGIQIVFSRNNELFKLHRSEHRIVLSIATKAAQEKKRYY